MAENLLGAQVCVSVGRSPRLSTQTGFLKCQSRTRRCLGGCWLCFRLCFRLCSLGGWESSWTQRTVFGLWRLPSLSRRCPPQSGSLSLTGTRVVAACFPGLVCPLRMTRESRGILLLYRELTFCCLPTMVYHNCVLRMENLGCAGGSRHRWGGCLAGMTRRGSGSVGGSSSG